MKGRGLTDKDVEYSRRVVVLSEEAKNTLFGDESAEDQKVSINGQSFKVVGVEKEDQSIYASFFSGKCYIPVSTFSEYVFNQVSSTKYPLPRRTPKRWTT